MTPALILLLLAAPLAAQFRAGVARVKITPDTPVWLTGFAARTKPATEVGLDLYAKALALETPSDKLVIVTADLLGFTKQVSDEVAARAARTHHLRRDQIVFFASHTHSGPPVTPRLTLSIGEGPDFDRAAAAYTAKLTDQLEALVTESLSKRTQATLAFGWTEAPFAINRRTEHLAGIRPGESFPAPTDHRVPVLRVQTAAGAPLAVLFGYACHNTVLTGDTYEVSGDYAGYAQKSLEQTQGVTALFVTLCAGDQRAAPRGTRALAEQHGRTLAAAVAAARTSPLAPTLRTTHHETTLPFTAHTREVYNAEARSADPFAARRGRAMLAALDSGRAITHAPYPIQAFRLGSLTWLALAGEVVVDYALTLRRQFGDNLVVAAYANDLPGYIPSLRVQREGGYEAGDSMMYFLQPGWFTEDVEPRVLAAAQRVLAELR
ncbi:MAG: neutral/alkaline non-lysosomal ceramidase N-terminal domain-containing protein [Bryobacteraceae bacterium]|nr:neutral/alkaline non-lysosomal ceramidase N-terminal domain-containing protein [Bryobacteraceae bacterium]